MQHYGTQAQWESIKHTKALDCAGPMAGPRRARGRGVESADSRRRAIRIGPRHAPLLRGVHLRLPLSMPRAPLQINSEFPAALHAVHAPCRSANPSAWAPGAGLPYLPVPFAGSSSSIMHNSPTQCIWLLGCVLIITRHPATTLSSPIPNLVVELRPTAGPAALRARLG